MSAPDELKGKDILDCAKCGSFASQALDLVGPRNAVRLGDYYIHCFDGDCGNEGPRSTDSDTSIRLWNALQEQQK